jgi:hypothetical protein
MKLNCIGATDEKQAATEKPPMTITVIQLWTVILQCRFIAMVDADYHFMPVDVRTNGRAW